MLAWRLLNASRRQAGPGPLAAAPRTLPGLWGAAESRWVWTDAPGGSPLDWHDSTVEKYAQLQIEPLSLAQLLECGRHAWFDSSKILQSAQFCQQELPKRLARRLLDLQLLPHIVVSNPHIRKVYHAYYHAFNCVRDLPPIQSVQQNEEFVALLRRLVDEHAPMLDALATGLREVRNKVGEKLQLEAFLENMLRSRLSRRVLAEQHIHLNNARPGYVGVICTDVGLADAVDFAASRCKQVCLEHYGMAPEVRITGDAGAKIAYIPAHLDYMLYELLKNSSRAVVERHRSSGGALGTTRLPPVMVRLCEAENELTVRISDQGGGIPPEHLTKVWVFGFSTLDPQRGASAEGTAQEAHEGLGMDTPQPSFGAAWAAMESNAGVGRFRIGGLGFGLPLSRVHARYFGGDLKLVSMPGYGVDTYLTLKRLEHQEWEEHYVEQATPSVVEAQ